MQASADDLAAARLSVHALLAQTYFSLRAADAQRALLAQTTGFASLDVFEFHRSADVMLALVIGGTDAIANDTGAVR